MELDSAETYLMAALESDPDDPEGLFLLGLIFSISEPTRAAGFIDKAADLEQTYHADSKKMLATLQRSDFADDAEIEEEYEELEDENEPAFVFQGIV